MPVLRKAHLRFRQMIRMDHNCETLFGLIRAER